MNLENAKREFFYRITRCRNLDQVIGIINNLTFEGVTQKETNEWIAESGYAWQLFASKTFSAPTPTHQIGKRLTMQLSNKELFQLAMDDNLPHQSTPIIRAEVRKRWSFLEKNEAGIDQTGYIVFQSGKTVPFSKESTTITSKLYGTTVSIVPDVEGWLDLENEDQPTIRKISDETIRALKMVRDMRCIKKGKVFIEPKMFDFFQKNGSLLHFFFGNTNPPSLDQKTILIEGQGTWFTEHLTALAILRREKILYTHVRLWLNLEVQRVKRNNFRCSIIDVPSGYLDDKPASAIVTRTQKIVSTSSDVQIMIELENRFVACIPANNWVILKNGVKVYFDGQQVKDIPPHEQVDESNPL